MKIVWDEPKRAANLEARGLDFAMVTSGFFEAAQILPGKNGRYIAIGRIDGRSRAVVFKPLGSEAVSIISLRAASPKERRIL